MELVGQRKRIPGNGSQENNRCTVELANRLS